MTTSDGTPLYKQNLWPMIETAMAPYHLKQEKQGARYRANSPLRAGSDSHSFILFLDASRPGGGSYYDNVERASGSFYQLAQDLRLIPEDTGYAKPGAPHGPIGFASLAEYARHQGAPVEAFTAALWTEGDVWCPKHRSWRPAFVFKTKTGTRTRFRDGLLPKYISPGGYVACWYGMPGALRIVKHDASVPLVLCNGEASVVVAQHYGVPAICTTGSGERPLTPELLDELQLTLTRLDVQAVLVALDCDTTGRRAAQALVQQLDAAGIAARAVDLQGDKGFDLANFAKLHQQDTAYALIGLPDAPAPPLPQSVGDLQKLVADLQVQLDEYKLIARRQAEMVAEARSEVATLKDFLRWQSEITAASRNIASASLRDTVEKLRLILDHDPAERDKHDGWVLVRMARLAEMAGISEATAGRHVKQLHDEKIIEKRTETERDGDGMPRSTTWVRALVDLSNPENVKIGKRYKGYVRCEHCGSVRLVKHTVVICEHCNEAHGDPKSVYVNPDEAIQEELAAGAPQVDAATDLADEDDRDMARTMMEAGHVEQAKGLDDGTTAEGDERPEGDTRLREAAVGQEASTLGVPDPARYEGDVAGHGKARGAGRVARGQGAAHNGRGGDSG